MDFSYVIITYNRRERLLSTLERLLRLTPAPRRRWELFVVDNASTDGSADAVEQRFGNQVNLIRLDRNLGMPARNAAISRASGRYIVLLDDDSHPLDDAVTCCVRYMDQHERTAAVSGRVLLNDGRSEASAFPGVFIGCATVLRSAALEQVGLFDERFFRQAEEYDLSFRLVAAGWRIERFENLLFRHEKHLGGRPGDLAVRMDLRNNLLLTQRYLGEPQRTIYREDWTQRYLALARHADQRGAADQALDEFEAMRSDEPHQPLTDSAFEELFQWQHQAEHVAAWVNENKIQRVLIGDLGKNIHATWRACRQAGLDITAIASGAPMFDGLDYRGTTVINDAEALAPRPDGIVISNINPAQVGPRLEQLRTRFDGPILTLRQGRDLVGPMQPGQMDNPLVPFDHRHAETFSLKPLPRRRLFQWGRLPDFLGIGAQKAGTSWLAKHLAAHPRVHMPTKEIHYFNQRPGQSLDRYRALFAKARRRLCGEFTPGYSVLPVERIRRIAELMPRVKLLLLLRDPVERAWSQALMNLVAYSDRSYEEVDDQEFYHHFLSAHSRQRTDYPAMLDRWLSVFDAGQLWIGFFEQITTEPRQLVRSALKHIGVDEPGDLDHLPLGEVVNRGPNIAIPPHFQRFLRHLYADQIAQMVERFGERVAGWQTSPEHAHRADIARHTAGSPLEQPTGGPS